MRSIVALALAASTLAACDSFAPAGPDPSRPSLLGQPAQPAPARATPASRGRGGDVMQDGWVPSVQAERGYVRPYPSQRRILDQQRGMLGQDVRQQDTSRILLQQQLQRGMESDRLDALRLQQQLEQQRRGY
jgi:hypothetical protein